MSRNCKTSFLTSQANGPRPSKGKGGKKDALIAGHYLMTMALLTHANLSDVLRNPRREMKGAVSKESLYLAFLSEWKVEFERAAL